MNGYKNLCAEIPEALHGKVREKQSESGQRLSQYITWLITTFYETEDKVTMSKEHTRTVAFQVPEELFEELKEYLKQNGLKQNAFFIECIKAALADHAGA